MKPGCHNLIQLHTILPDFPEADAKIYRAKFEEWLEKDKLYCPVPRCSTFIPSRLRNPATSSRTPSNQVPGLTPNQQSKSALKEVSITTCPACQLAICTTCKQKDHRPSPCDFSEEDEERAMLRSFGYKRCPHCKRAVRRMLGCQHLQCVCGEHWCWDCGKRNEECGANGCDQDDHDDDDNDDDDNDTSVANTTVTRVQNAIRARKPDNLDARSDQHWQQSGLNFGPEPDERRVLLSSCDHLFDVFPTFNDGFYRGELARMECNRCFQSLDPAAEWPTDTEEFSDKPTSAKGEGKKRIPWECRRCKLIMCSRCAYDVSLADE